MVFNSLVSVIIPVYNVRPYLSEALESVIRQTHKNLEILVIDDGSTDGSGALCDKAAAADSRIRVIHQKNKGLSAARNEGLARMTGDAVAFLDPDDAYEDTFVEKLLAVMAAEEADVTVGNYVVCRTTEKLLREGEPSLPAENAGTYSHDRSLRALADGVINIGVWNKLYKRELWREIRFPEGQVHEDIATVFRLFDLCDKVVVLGETLYRHRRRPGSITTTPSLKSFRDRQEACTHFAAFMEEHIPDTFSRLHAKRWRQSTVNKMIAAYLNAGETGGGGTAFRARLREQIVAVGKETGIDTLSIPKQLAWHMLRLCPRMIGIVYPLYRPIGRLSAARRRIKPHK